jgi:hypothetical protein
VDNWEDRYVGRWFDGNGTEIEIVKVRRHRFVVSYLRDGQPVPRPWMNNRPSIEMPARYIEDPLDGDDFVVDLTESQGDYSLHLHYEECDYLLPENDEIISTAVSGPERYDKAFLDQCSSLFLCHDHLHRSP